jgi:hypothetical protein
MNFRQMVLYSTPKSRDAGKISALAVVETLLSVALFWWLAMTFGSYLHLWLAILAAPLFLLRSPASIALGADLFRRYWEAENSHRISLSFAPMALFAGCCSGLVTWLLADLWLAAATGMASFWIAVLLAVVAANIGMTIAVSAWGFWALTDGKVAAVAVAGVATAAAVVAVALVDRDIFAMSGVGGAAAIILLALTIAGLAIEKALVGQVLRGIGAAAFFVIFGIAIVSQSTANEAAKAMFATIWLAVWIFGAIAAVGGLVGTRGLALVATGAGVGIFIRARAIRFIATLRHPAPGLRALPGNWLSFIFQRDTMQRPEVIPGLAAEHMLRSENRHAFWDGVSHLEDWKNMLVVGFFLEFPALLFRISLKSTAWLYLPLVYFAFLPARRRDD